MTLLAFIFIALLSMNDARLRNHRFQSRRQRGQMGFKWTRKHRSKRMNVENSEYGSNEVEPENQFTTSSIPYGLGINSPNDKNEPDFPDADVPEPTLNTEIDEIPPPVVIGNTVEPEIDMKPFTTMDIEQENHDEHEPPIMDCLYDKCHDIFMNCFDDEQCKEYMREWQERQSLSDQCLPSTPTNDAIPDEPMVTDYPTNNQECEYDELFWNTYHCGVEHYCYNDQLVLATSHQYLLSPSNYRVPATNVVGSRSSFDFTLLMVAITSGISAVILVEVLRRLYNGLKGKCECKCDNPCKGFSNSFRYLRNKWEQIQGYKYEKTHDNLAAIEEDDDDAIYGSNNLNDLQTGGNIGVTYNGVINDDSSISDDEELQKCSSSKPISLDQQTDEDGDIHTDEELTIPQQAPQPKENENNQNNEYNDDEQKDTEELVEESTYLSSPAQQL